MEQADTVSVLLPWLTKTSYNEVLSTAAIRGFGESHDLAALDPLIALSKAGKARSNRMAALAALAKLAKAANGDKKQLGRIEARVDGLFGERNVADSHGGSDGVARLW
jgi:hypothetical protein